MVTPVAETRRTSDKPSVLVIEDEREMAQELYLGLTEAGYDVRIAETEAEVFTSARAYPPSVMVVDRLLHGTDCLPMIEQLRAEGNTVPMVVISALTSVDDRIRGLRAEATTISSNPSSWANLSRASRRCSGAQTTAAP